MLNIPRDYIIYFYISRERERNVFYNYIYFKPFTFLHVRKSNQSPSNIKLVSSLSYYVFNGQWLPPHRDVDERSVTVECVELAGNKSDPIGVFPGRSSTITTTRMSRTHVKALLAVFCIAQVHGIMFYLEPNSHKCLKEEVHADVLVTGEYEVSEAIGQKTDYVIQDSKGHILSQKEDIPHGKPLKFSFVTETYDTFEICFASHVPNHQRGIRQEVMLITKRGIEAKSYEGIGEAAKLKPVEVELKRLEDLSEAIVQDFARMRKNEEEMRDTNEATNTRVLYFSLFSICILLGLSTWQLFYFRRFFRMKKLIE